MSRISNSNSAFLSNKKTKTPALTGVVSFVHIDDSEFQIDIGHIYSHINRSWNSRNRVGEENFNLESKFPNDIKPI